MKIHIFGRDEHEHSKVRRGISRHADACPLCLRHGGDRRLHHGCGLCDRRGRIRPRHRGNGLFRRQRLRLPYQSGGLLCHAAQRPYVKEGLRGLRCRTAARRHCGRGTALAPAGEGLRLRRECPAAAHFVQPQARLRFGGHSDNGVCLCHSRRYLKEAV